MHGMKVMRCLNRVSTNVRESSGGRRRRRSPTTWSLSVQSDADMSVHKDIYEENHEGNNDNIDSNNNDNKEECDVDKGSHSSEEERSCQNFIKEKDKDEERIEKVGDNCDKDIKKKDNVNSNQIADKEEDTVFNNNNEELFLVDKIDDVKTEERDDVIKEDNVNNTRDLHEERTRSPGSKCTRPRPCSMAKTLTSRSASPNSPSSLSLSKKSSLYASILREQQEDERWQREVALGRRFALYKFKSELLGTGNFSKVRLATHVLTQERVAVKVIDKTKLDGRTQKMLLREMHIMEALAHPALIRLYEVCETVCSVHLVLECASGGELFARISDHGPMSEENAATVFAQIASALHYMHEHNMVHRDVKAENVFLAHPASSSSEWQVKLGDFGFATHVSDKTHMLNTFCGSPPYAAPELFVDDHYRGDLVDIWALGVLLYFMVSAQMPFQGQSVPALKAAIVEGNFVQPLGVSEQCRSIINAILKQRPQDRMTLEQMRSCSWLRGAFWPCAETEWDAWLSSDKEEKSEEERRTLDLLASIGIDEQLIRREARLGARSPVIGTYRIVRHKRVRDLDVSWGSSGRGSTAFSLTSSSAPSEPSSLNNSASRYNAKRSRKRSKSRPMKSKLCAII